MLNDQSLLPAKPFFECQESSFSIMNAVDVQRNLLGGTVVPVISFSVAAGNIFETRPIKAINQSGLIVSVACAGDVTILLDFDSESARKVTQEGEFVYLGGIDEGNYGRGWLKTQ